MTDRHVLKMVKLTTELIVKQGPGHNKRRADESSVHYLSRITHLQFPSRGIDSVDIIPACRHLTVIYLYDNALTKIENLNFAENLTHLYLQNNRLQKLENLDFCPKLQKLYLGGNQLRVLEGLDKCVNLTELYVENQHLPEGEKLVFEPRTIQALAKILQVLNVSGNNLDSLVELSVLVYLEELTASNNNLQNLRELVQLLSIWPKLKRLDTNRNPICLKARYRERLIVVSTTLGMPNNQIRSKIFIVILSFTCLEVLDGKPITENSRRFLVNWKASREAQQKRETTMPDMNDLSGDFQSSHINGGDSNGINDYHRNSLKPDNIPLVKKGLFPMALVENAQRKLTATTRNEKFSALFTSGTLPSSGTHHPPLSSNRLHTVTFVEPSTKSLLK
ncbi:unnamed protein product [Didymodactylos carnosus]|uniref:Protein phosphatase 1 regulatory subunit 42 n=1 Tax=Didymodactylos carnosus TaxID=1234261 RepID=A0A813UFW3_9BILA|nr:unnamed protein product [Didymodactylos carnosus]CAF0828567.1 unnamed protein product [Didymodactylos carnosus]CAF3502898.1 unnamed protein product [Didymodactylos carnosus]CAF3615527.1 unnamed protein product [Didymodactylos carnosus]